MVNDPSFANFHSNASVYFSIHKSINFGVSRFISTFVNSSKHANENTMLFSKLPPFEEEERFTDRLLLLLLQRGVTTLLLIVEPSSFFDLRRNIFLERPSATGKERHENVIREWIGAAAINHMWARSFAFPSGWLTYHLPLSFCFLKLSLCGNYFILGGKRGERGEQTGRSLFSQKDKSFLFFHKNPETSWFSKTLYYLNSSQL